MAPRYYTGMKAIYTPSSLTKNNPMPFYEALPPFVLKDLKEELQANTFFFNPAWRDQSVEDRVMCLKTMQLEFFLALDRDVEIRTAVQQSLFARYSRMAPLDSKFYIPRGASSPIAASENIGVLGMSRGGKSQSLKALYRCFPAWIGHDRYRYGDEDIVLETKKSIPILPIICPESGGSIGLYQTILEAIRNTVGTPYTMPKSITHGESMVKAAANSVGLGCIGIDEVHNIFHHGSRKQQVLAGFTRLNEFGIPLILAGEATVLDYLKPFLHASGRSAGVSPWRRMENNEYFRNWVKKVLEFYITDKPWPFSEELANFLHTYSMGLVGPVIRVVLMAQQIALVKGRKAVNQRDVEEAVKSRLYQLTTSLNHLKIEEARKENAARKQEAKRKGINVPFKDSPVDIEKVVALPPLPIFGPQGL